MEDCLFCRIIAGEIPSDKLYEDDGFIAFRDINPQSPVHVLVVPKKHKERLADCSDNDKTMLSGLLLVANKVARDEGIAESGYRVTINSGPEGGQLIYHLHLHLMGGHKLSDQMG
ncbi:MAG: histidine triad nucleotide-binding protein [Proteobacteria bacterium]|nr:histidine triad nucleotide-binding protein [Pseudomonadota bacterium]